MRKILFLFICCFSLQIQAQEASLAFLYLRNGEYEKAAAIYKTLHEKNPLNSSYLTNLVTSYQQLENFNEVASIINKQLEKRSDQYYLLVELGYNYQLQYKQDSATFFYEKALKSIEKSKNKGYLIGRSFQKNHLLDYALIAFKKSMEFNPNANFNLQIAAIYGEKADLENMFNTYLNLVETNLNYLPTAKTYIGRYITDDSENEANIFLRRLLIKKMQNNPQNSWNELLSWLYMQQKEYSKAFIQEKALFKRDASSLKGITDLGGIAFKDKNYTVSQECFKYILDNTTIVEEQLRAKLYLLQIAIKTDAEINSTEQKFQELFSAYGKSQYTISIQLVYAEFLAFRKNEPEDAISLLKDALKLPISEFEKGSIKTKLADILVYTNKFSTALIYYTQVQNDLKSHTIGQTARFKIAQTSYFKGDFEWAQSQLKVLKNSTSQLIANDALDLNLLITDNVVKDSLKIALKTYAKADLLAFQNKNQAAIDTLQVLLNNFKGHSLEDEALFKQAQLLEKHGGFIKAESNYLQIIALNKDDILVDDAIYYVANLYLNQLENIEKAKEYYQTIIFEYPSSIYLVDARKKYRKLRGDVVN
ncbi:MULTISPECIES: tetratricopeptide repeat protein [Flavobacteriaceae]|uniref:Tetratricopeptide repeat protein n=2 Tax=Flavobacteriaceae TaxID=49546 RepID=A0A4Y8AS81_9FLAO|nr:MULTISPECIES: tetratricopeptide repeat protein [Flavobacteriaceae]TEW74051.1 tetratricopeptide repeat protein [Gramella jeungdoensis]